jgi:hypothetical protein
MGDPVTTGMMIGAVGGALTSKNPIQGAMMGGALGAAGGSFAGGAMGAGSAAPALGTTSAASGFAGGNLAAAQSAVNPTLMQRVGAGFSGIGSDIGAANKYLNQNPFTAQAGMSLAQSAFEPEQPMQMAPAGQIRQGQPQPMDYMSLLNPQQQTVARPQPFSLL